MVKLIIAFILLSSTDVKASIFGEETLVLVQMAATQLKELASLAENVGVAREHLEALRTLNEGIDKTTSQIEAIESIYRRAQNLDPRNIRSLSDINYKIHDLKSLRASVEDLIKIKIALADQAIAESSLQSDTAYKMGQEMVSVGARLAEESKTAAPGRATQITASAASAQMLASGVELQTLSKIAELQALSLEMQKMKIQDDFSKRQAEMQLDILAMNLAKNAKRGRP